MPVAIPSVSVSIQNFDGNVVYRNLTINQAVNDHHHFSFVWNVGSLAHDVNSQLDLVRNNIGSVVTIEIDDNTFQGIITQISIHEQTDSTQSFSVKGQSLSILLDDIPRAATYYKKDLKKIIEATLDGLPGNVLQTDISPKSSGEHHYITQYNETDWRFLQRLATRYGEWLYFDGTKLAFGPVGDTGATLRSGSNLTSYTIKANIVPNKYSYSSYDYHKGEPVLKELGNFSSDVQNDFSSAAADKSSDVYSRATDRPMHNFNIANSNMADDIAELEMKRLAAQLLFASGESKHGGLKPGCTFTVETANGNYEYVATQVIHISNVVGHYENTFHAVPASVKVPPYSNPHVFRQADVQTAIVKENHDPDGINRLKVQFFWQKQNDMTPWIRLATPHAGGGKGMHIVPEKGEEVIVCFEGGDVEKPFVVNSIYSGSSKSGGGDADNNIKSFSSRSGNKISLDDQAGSVTVVDKSGNSISIDGAGNIAINCSESITLTTGQSSLSMKKDGSIDLKGVAVNIIGDDVLVKGNNSAGIGTDAASFASNKGGDADVTGTKTTVSGKSDVVVTGVNATLNGDATAKLSSMGPTSVEGAIVKLN